MLLSTRQDLVRRLVSAFRCAIPFVAVLGSAAPSNAQAPAASTPALVKDIRTGAAPTDISNLTDVNGLLFFVAEAGIDGKELWRSDGTETGTRVVKDIYDGFGGSVPSNLTVFNGLLYFSAYDGNAELWRSDGSDAGTVKVITLTEPGQTSASPEELTVIGNTLFFTVHRTGGRQLWKTDGTGGGTQLVRAFTAVEGELQDLEAAGSSLFFRTRASNGVVSLWHSDGTTGGTLLLRSFPDGNFAMGARREMLGVGNTLYFSQYDSITYGEELWTSDGTVAGTRLVKDIVPGGGFLGGSKPTAFTNFNGTLAFYAVRPGSASTWRLWTSDGTEQGTNEVTSVVQSAAPLAVQAPIVLGGTLYFLGLSNAGFGLWRSDGTAFGTTPVSDALSPNAPELAIHAGALYFAGMQSSDLELWRSDGTPPGTARLADLYPGFGSSRPTDFTSVGGALFFVADDGIHGRELWRLGMPASTPADLQITATASAAAVVQNTSVTYTLTITNLGPNPATGVAVSDTLPAGLTFVSCAATGGTCGATAGARTIAFASIPSGGSRTATIVATVTAAVGAAIANSAAVSAVTTDPNPANNTASVTVTAAQGGTPTDTDADGLPNDWEVRFGLNAAAGSGADGADGDPDSDGRTNRQEFEDGTHPRGTFSRYLSEGATSNFFRTRISLLNPLPTPAKVLLRFLKSDGTTVSKFLDMPGRRRETVEPHTLPGLEVAEFSTTMEADDQVVVDRTMTWGRGYGSHAESGVPTPSPVWYLAEGSTVGPFNLFYLLQNPDLRTAAAVQVSYLLPQGPPLVRTYVLPANSRQNIWVDSIPELAATDVSAILQVVAGPNIIVERAMYLDRPGQPFAAGHESAGVTTPSLQWFFAEGATGNYFDEFILIANPNTSPLVVHATFLLPSGQTLEKDYQISPSSRFNIWVDEEEFPGLGKALADTAVSVTLTGGNAQPFIAERAMWWPGPTSATWGEAHNSPGATATGTSWAMADGEVGGTDETDTYILIANTSTTAAQVKVTLFIEGGDVLESATPYVIGPQSRFNVWVAGEFPGASGRRFGALVESLGAPPAQLVVERAMYSNADGVVWAAGTNALATRLPGVTAVR